MNDEIVPQQINLLITRYQKTGELFSARRIMGAWLALIALLALYTGYLCFESVNLGMKSATSLAQKQNVIADLDNLANTTPKGISHPVDMEIERLEKEKERKLHVKKLLNGSAPGNSRGFSGHMEGLAKEIIPNVWLTAINIDEGGNYLSIQGSTLDPKLIPRFIERLSSEQSFAGSEFRTFIITKPEYEKDRKDRQARAPRPHLVNFIIRTSGDKEEESPK